jgi:hypothetical protein
VALAVAGLVMLANLKLQDIGTILAIMLALGGLVHSNSKAMSGLEEVTRQHTDDIARIDINIDRLDEKQQADRAAIVKMQAGIDFLVRQEKNREGGR